MLGVLLDGSSIVYQYPTGSLLLRHKIGALVRLHMTGETNKLKKLTNAFKTVQF